MIDPERTRALLAALAREVGEGTLLWRGVDLTGSDIDVVVLRGWEERIDPLLTDDVVVDVLHASDWPAEYPRLEGVLARATSDSSTPPVASPEDRLLIYAAEVVRGRDVAKLASKARALLAEPGVRERLRALSRVERSSELAELISDPDALERQVQRDVLPYRRAAAVALRCRAARVALMRRAGAGFRRRLRRLLQTSQR